VRVDRLRRVLVALQLLTVALAAAAALVPLPAGVVERDYADWFYPALQSRLTAWSNQTRISLFDVLAIFAGLFMIVLWIRWLRSARKRRSLWPVVAGVAHTAVLAAVFYLWFQIAWGLNYARVPLETVIDYDRGRVTPAALTALAERATRAVNDTHQAGHAAGFATSDQPWQLAQALHDVERQLGKPVPTTPSRPKATLLGIFFRASGVDGMHAPFLLETLLNPDLTPPERPAVLAHEWAHLAGYAPEDDASFVGLLSALQADPGSRYSAWLALFHDAVVQLPVSEQRRLVGLLEPGPQADRQAISKRLQARVEPLSRASWEAYDRYLKAQGVSEGVASYSRVIQLLLGSGVLDPDGGGRVIKSPSTEGRRPAEGRN
jgi:hypothetical protein